MGSLVPCPTCKGSGRVQAEPMTPAELEGVRVALGRAWGFAGAVPHAFYGILLSRPRRGPRLSERTVGRYLRGERSIPAAVAARAEFWRWRLREAERHAAWQEAGSPDHVPESERGRPLPQLPPEVDRRRRVMLERKHRAAIYTAARAAAWKRGEAFRCPFTGKLHPPPATGPGAPPARAAGAALP